jgi:hypothetical protein
MILFSDYVGALRALAGLPSSAYIMLLIFVGVGFVAGKFFRALVLRGHPVILTMVALVNYGFVANFFETRQLVLAIMFFTPLLFMGREAYLRLVGDARN